MHGSVQVAGGIVLAVQEEIPDAQMPLFAQEPRPVIAAGVPLGGQIPAGIPVSGSLEGHGRGQLMVAGKPRRAVSHGLHPYLALRQQRFQLF